MGAERDKIVLLQASLLMGFWHSEEDEHMQPWYWTGNAINICQMLGLHRNPDSSRYNSSISNRQRFLWRRLWWSCFFRDRWLSLTLGRPLRINLSDCDTPRPLVTDILNDIDRISESSLAEYVPSDLPRLAEFWIILIELSELLGQVLIMNYQVHRPKPSIFQIESLESQVLQCKLPDRYEAGLNRLVKFYSHHVHLHFQSVHKFYFGKFNFLLTSSFEQSAFNYLLWPSCNRNSRRSLSQPARRLATSNGTQSRCVSFADK